jgi:hypothetical protein
MTAQELRDRISTARLPWTVNPNLSADAPIPPHSLGADTSKLLKAINAPVLNLKQVLLPTSNTFLLERRIELQLADPVTIISKPVVGPVEELRSEAPVVSFGTGAAAAPAPQAGVAASVDWRVRWGWPWIATIQDQDGCESCWAFCATALVESMTRIEHFIWSKRSEGDIHDGMGAKCANTGSPDAALDWIAKNGICDPDCYPWRTNNPPYKPTPDRPGRTVKIPGHTAIGDIASQKKWLDTVGPLGVTFNVYEDFDGYHTGVYIRDTHPTNHLRGGHCVLIVGYDDSKQAWLMRNSWGTGWGMNGYCWIGYGQADIDTWAKLGVQGTNPDPWSKRRTHSGSMIESGDGTGHKNFELLAASPNGEIVHYWREGTALTWAKAETFGNDARWCPTLTGTTYNRNFESIHTTKAGRLHHWFFDQASNKWLDGGIFGPTDAVGVPGFLQGNYGAPGNFEVVVSTKDGRLNHWWRMDGPPWTWGDGGRFGSNIGFSGPSLIQSHFGKQGNFELVAVLNTGQMQHFWRDNDGGMVWHAGVTFGAGVTSSPCMIEGEFGESDENHVGNFELCVAAGGQIQHWWRDNQGDQQWRHSATFGSNIECVAALLEGSYDFNLELVAQRTDNQLQHFWRDGAGWHAGVVIGPA